MKKLLLTIALVLICSTAYAFDLQVGWDVYPDKDIISGFKLKIGEVSGTYPTVLTITDVNAVTYTVPAFDTTFPKKKYFMVLTAFNATDESDNSNEIIYTKPLGKLRIIKLQIVGGKIIWQYVPYTR